MEIKFDGEPTEPRLETGAGGSAGQPVPPTIGRAFGVSDREIEDRAKAEQMDYQHEMALGRAEPGPREFDFEFSRLSDKLVKYLENGQTEVVHGFSAVKIGISTKHVKTYEIEVRHPDVYLAADVAKELSQELDRFCENPFI